VTFDELVGMIREAAYADDQTCRFFADELQKLENDRREEASRQEYLADKCAAGPWIPVGERPTPPELYILIRHELDGDEWVDVIWFTNCTAFPEHATHWAEIRGPK